MIRAFVFCAQGVWGSCLEVKPPPQGPADPEGHRRGLLLEAPVPSLQDSSPW